LAKTDYENDYDYEHEEDSITSTITSTSTNGRRRPYIRTGFHLMTPILGPAQYGFS
jgi:hypothetical protein